MEEFEKSSVLVITGATASGKTEAALELAKHDGSIEIVNADSQLLYKGFDIGTAKPPKAVRDYVRHHLIDILDPEERFSAADYKTKAREAIRDIVARGRKPVVVGGTGFYLDALFRGLMQEIADEQELASATERYRKELEQHGFEGMLARLEELDPVLFAQVSRERNPIRLERAWTHYFATGIPLGESRKEERDAFEFRPEYRVIERSRAELSARIEQRVDKMLAEGWTKEVQNLLSSGVTTDMPAMRAIGYREIAAVVLGVMKPGVAREQVIIRTRQYAKRQLTWIRHSLH